MTHSGTFLVRCDPGIAFDLLSSPESFAPLLPDFESMTVQDATHFTMRTALAIGKIKGHIDLSMEMAEATRPFLVQYRGQGIIANSPLSLELEFRISTVCEVTEVYWAGQVTLSGALVFIAGELLDTMSRQNFERMAVSVQRSLQEVSPPSVAADNGLPDLEI